VGGVGCGGGGVGSWVRVGSNFRSGEEHNATL
jgi:hypothetical protein